MMKNDKCFSVFTFSILLVVITCKATLLSIFETKSVELCDEILPGHINTTAHANCIKLLKDNNGVIMYKFITEMVIILFSYSLALMFTECCSKKEIVEDITEDPTC